MTMPSPVAARARPHSQERLVKGLYALKPWYSKRLDRFTRWAVAEQISPDLFTLVGVAAGAAAGAALWQGWWLPSGLLLAVRLAGANLDGAVARARGVSRAWGFVLNELGDRSSDLLMFAGLALLAARTGGPVWLVLAAPLAATLPTFASLCAAGAGATRLNGGPFGKTERCAAAVVAAAFPGILGWIAGVMIAGSLAAAALRLTAAHREIATPAGVLR